MCVPFEFSNRVRELTVPVWVLEELQLPYDVKVHFRQPDARSPDSLRQVTIAGKVSDLSLSIAGSRSA